MAIGRPPALTSFHIYLSKPKQSLNLIFQGLVCLFLKSLTYFKKSGLKVHYPVFVFYMFRIGCRETAGYFRWNFTMATFHESNLLTNPIRINLAPNLTQCVHIADRRNVRRVFLRQRRRLFLKQFGLPEFCKFI